MRSKMKMRKRRTGERLKVGIVISSGIAVLEDFLNGFYRSVRPRLDWHVKQTSAEEEMIPLLEEWGADVIIISSTKKVMAQAYQIKLAQPIFVLATEECRDFPWVHMDEEAIGTEAAKYLINCGYRNLACFSTSNHYAAKMRMKGFAHYAENHGFEPFLYDQSNWGIDPKSFIFGTEDVDKWLAALPVSTGLYTWSDGMAMWLMESCFRQNIKIPNRIGILGTDNNRNFCSATWPNLDSVILRYSDLGVQTAQWIENWANGIEETFPQPLSPVGIMRRSSTRLQVGADSVLSGLFDKIHETPLNQLDLDKLVESTGLSRRTLDRRCIAENKLSLRETIELKRLEKAEYLLSNTNRTVLDIADACGFATSRSLEMLFKKYHKMTPAVFANIRRVYQ